MAGTPMRPGRGRGRAGSLAWAALLGVIPAAGVLAVAGTAPALAAVDPVPSCSSGTCTVAFPATGAAASWTVPAGVSSATVTLDGAQGGAGGGQSFPPHAPGGLGATVVATIPVTAGDVYTVHVGGAAPGGGSEAGGYNGGGTTGDGGGGDVAIVAGGGGGASDFAFGGTLLAVAGGGGGGGGNGVGAGAGGAGGAAGGAGGPSGGAGTAGANDAINPGHDTGGGGGGAGTAAGLNGGAAGTADTSVFSGTAGSPGTSGSGGAGAIASLSGMGSDGGGGGGGYYGGGGGGSGGNVRTVSAEYTGSGGGGGGGGSDYVTPTATSSTITDGVWAGDGQVTISYADPATPPLTITHINAAANQHRQAVAGVTFTDPRGRLSQLSGSINWGDSTITAIPHRNFITVPQQYGGGFTAGGTHAYAKAGTYTVTITIHDSNGASATKSTTLTVPGHQGLLGGLLGLLHGLLPIL